MNSQETVLALMRDLGQQDALALRAGAHSLDGTALIAQERKIPPFDPQKDYSIWPVGAPVQDAGQVYTLLQPHDAARYDQRPAALPALWHITHTRDAARAKPYLPPNGVSGLYAIGECCTENGRIYRSICENNGFAPSALPEQWEDIGEAVP